MRITSTGISRLAWVTCLLAASGTGASFAQTGNSDSTDYDTWFIEEVIVTAQRREQTLLEVPIAVSVLSADTLNNTFSNNIEDIQRLVPSVTVSGAISPTGSSVRIRGVGTNVFSVTVEPSVSLVIDGVALPRNDVGLVELADIERVEVLKGPQGTLFGKNASAGVISYTTKAPSETFAGTLRGRMTTDEDYRLDGTISNSISDTTGFRLTGFYSETADFQDNLFTGTEIGGSEAFGARGKLFFEPSSALRINLTADFYDLESNCCAIPLREAAGATILELAGGVMPGSENTTVSADRDPINTMEQWGLAAEVSWDVGAFSLTSLSSFRDWKTGGNLQDVDFFASDGGNSPVVGGTGLQQQAFQEAETISQEFRLTPLTPGRFDFVLGAFYFQNKLDRFFDRDVFLCFAPSPADAPIGSACAAPFQLDAFFTLNVDTTNIAAFGDVAYQLNDNLALIGGLRLLHDELEFQTDTSNGFVGGDTLDDTDLIGRVGFRYDLADQMTSFLTYSRGYKSGAFDATLGITDAVLAGGPVDPETSDAFELGLRGDPFGNGKLFVDVNLFHNSYEDFHVQAFDPDNAGAAALQNAGETVTRGVEVSALWTPNGSFTLNAGAQYLDAVFEDFVGAACFSGQTEAQGCITDVNGRQFQDVSGQTVPNAPEWKLSLTPRYEVGLGSGARLFWQSVISYQSEVQFSSSQDPNTIQDDYSLVDLSAGYIAPDERFRLSIFGRNVFDEFYTNSIAGTFLNDPGGYFHIVPRGAERVIGAELEVNF